MELLISPETSSGGPAVRKKRSDLRRRPRSDPSSWQLVLTLQSSPTDFEGNAVVQTFRSFSLASADVIKSDENYLEKPSLESGRFGNKGKLKKVKLKLGGITHTLHTNSSSKICQQKQNVSKKNVSDGEEDSSRKTCQDTPAMCESYNYKLVHKSGRFAKKHAFDDGFDDEDDEEIRYLKKVQASRASSGYGDKLDESCRKTKGISNIMGLNRKGGRESRIYEDNDYEKELASVDELKDTNKSLTEVLADPLTGSGHELTMTTRKRALECLDSGVRVEFSDGLLNAPSKKQKMSEVEQQLRKAEAAQRRRLQAEKAAKEAETEAIRKILGQDSYRKKKEEKLKKQQEELAQEKAGKAAVLGPSTVRYIMGPQGTVVMFSEDLGLPNIFDYLPCRYPPLREKCVGPNCENEYKYRDSKSKLPLCSLHCYKAVQGNVGILPAC